ncbi:MAG TPA: hypothetical protein VN815_01935 [Steroidobacteraceae bacterium]|jgi:hypothetical protein|nr:hypothetical protein [Steroidobacteraceae bacterium]
MNTRLVIKLSAVAVALLVNGLVLGGAAYLVHSQEEQPTDSSVACSSAKIVHIRV